MQTQASRPLYDVVIVDGGPAALAHAVYAASEQLRTVIVELCRVIHTTGGVQAVPTDRLTTEIWGKALFQNAASPRAEFLRHAGPSPAVR